VEVAVAASTLPLVAVGTTSWAPVLEMALASKTAYTAVRQPVLLRSSLVARKSVVPRTWRQTHKKRERLPVKPEVVAAVALLVLSHTHQAKAKEVSVAFDLHCHYFCPSAKIQGPRQQRQPDHFDRESLLRLQP
jgi:hypothetical protein